MKEFKEIFISNGELVYKIIERLKKNGELEDSWFLISREASSRIVNKEDVCLEQSRYISGKFDMA